MAGSDSGAVPGIGGECRGGRRRRAWGVGREGEGVGRAKVAGIDGLGARKLVSGGRRTDIYDDCGMFGERPGQNGDREEWRTRRGSGLPSWLSLPNRARTETNSRS